MRLAVRPIPHTYRWLLAAAGAVALAATIFTSQQRADAVPVGLVEYVALGDSVTAQNQYVPAYAGHIGLDLNASVATTNLGGNGWFSGSVRNSLQNNPLFQDAVADADAVTLFIGLNDFQWWRAQYLDPDSVYCPPPKDGCMPAMVAAFQVNWSQILWEISSLNASPALAVRALTIYNPYVAQDVAGGNFDYFNSFLAQMNATILASEDQGVVVGDLHAIFNGTSGDIDATAAGYFTAPDVLHPNAAGHAAMAAALRDLGYAELDTDGDGLLDVEVDADGDGCSNIEEAGSLAVFGGQRDPANASDFYDVNGTRNIDAIDIGMVRGNFNPLGPVPVEDRVFDRRLGSAVWAPGPGDNKINAVDIALIRASFNHTCVAPS